VLVAIPLDAPVARSRGGRHHLRHEVGRTLHAAIGDDVRAVLPHEQDIRLQVVPLVEEDIEGAVKTRPRSCSFAKPIRR
jgi:hypothetical protein